MKSIQDMVIDDIEERKKIGIETYGEELFQNRHGRNMLVEAYAEAMDLVIYLKCAIVEQEENEKAKEFGVPTETSIRHSDGSKENVMRIPLRDIYTPPTS